MTQLQLIPTLLSGAESANKPTLIVGPSLGTGVAALWGPAVPYLDDAYQVIGWDLPGHGVGTPSTDDFTMSELADGVAAVVARLKADGTIDAGQPVYYAGVSIAGATALQLGVDHPGLFDALAVICSAAKIGTPEAWRERGELVAQAGTPTMVEGSAQRWFAPGFIESHAQISTNLLHTLQDADRFSYAHACSALAGYDVRDRLSGITDPVLAIAGAHDVVCPPADAEAVAAAVPNGRAAVVDDAAHLAPAEDPRETSRLLLEFFGALVK